MKIEDVVSSKYIGSSHIYTDRIRLENGWLYRTYIGGDNPSLHTIYVQDN